MISFQGDEDPRSNSSMMNNQNIMVAANQTFMNDRTRNTKSILFPPPARPKSKKINLQSYQRDIAKQFRSDNDNH